MSKIIDCVSQKSCLAGFIFGEILNFAFLGILIGKTLLLRFKTNRCTWKTFQRTVSELSHHTIQCIIYLLLLNINNLCSGPLCSSACGSGGCWGETNQDCQICECHWHIGIFSCLIKKIIFFPHEFSLFESRFPVHLIIYFHVPECSNLYNMLYNHIILLSIFIKVFYDNFFWCSVKMNIWFDACFNGI